MRRHHLIFGDLKFQAKYGFYFLYTVLSVIYLFILFAIPAQWRQKAASILIFSDPSALGLFFMGAIILLEKSQRVHCAFAVSPVKAGEYVCSKVISLGTVSVIVAAILAVFAKVNRVEFVLIGTVLSSVMFTLTGIIIATKITSLNQFIIATVPIEIIGFVPAIFYFLSSTDKVIGCYPPNVCMDLIAGNSPSVIGVILTFVLILLLFLLARRDVQKMWMRMGGVKL